METQLHTRQSKPRKENLIEVNNNRGFIKPQGGFWTSTYDQQLRGSEWVEAARDMWGENHPSQDTDNWWVLEPEEDIRIFTVDDFEDLKELVKHYNYEVPEMVITMFALLDFEKIAEKYDGIHLTSRGQAATRLSHPSLYGWDCESTLWFRWCFRSVVKFNE